MKIRNEKGITIIALVITVIVLLFIAAVSINSGIQTIKSTQLAAFQAELDMMQAKLNEIVVQYKRENKNIGIPLTDNEKRILDVDEVNSILSKKAQEKGITIETLKNGFSLCTKEYIKQELGIENIERDYIVNLENTIVIASEKFEHNKTDYYMLEQFDDGLYNVSFNNQISPTGSFTVNTEQIGEEFEIRISPNHEKYVSKWNIKYKLSSAQDWETENKLIFTISSPGVYQISVTHGNEIDLGTQTIVLKAGNPDEEGYYTQDNTINGKTEGSSYNPLIPDEYKPLEEESMWGDGSTAPSKEAINDGLKIQDKNGNQYVWVPVDETMSRSLENIDKNNNLLSADGEIKLNTNSTNQDVEELKNSVQEYGGYYMSK